MGRGPICVLCLGMLFSFFLFLTVLMIIITSYVYTKTTTDDYHQCGNATNATSQLHRHEQGAKVWLGDGGREREEGEVDMKSCPRDIDNNVSWAVVCVFFLFCCTNDFLLLAHVVNGHYTCQF